MTLNEIRQLANHGENLTLEFKKKANHPEKIVKELVAFANTEGGTLLLGVDDDGTTSGVRSVEGELFVLEESIRQLIRPKLLYTTELIKVNEKKGIAVVMVEPSQGKVYRVRSHSGQQKGKAYIRRKDKSIQASKAVCEIIERRHKKKDIQFVYDEKVQMAISLCEKEEHTTTRRLKEEAKISKYLATRVLIRLVLANVLEVEPREEEDLYYLKNNHSSDEEWH